MKCGLTLYFYILFSMLNSYCQDIIILKNGDEIKSKVMEISVDIIKYKKWDNQDGPIYSSLKEDIFMIKYQNGTKDLFNGNKSQENSTLTTASKSIFLKKPEITIDSMKVGYIGENKEGKKDGYGIMVYSDGNIYEGYWKDDLREGQGKFYYKNEGFTYQGGWKNNKKEGFGINTWNDGNINYQGEFKDGLPDGKGVTFDKGVKVYDGEWKNGKKNGKGILDYKTVNGTLHYEGNFVNDVFDGPATLIANITDGSRTVYSGYFLNGELEGQGTETNHFNDGRSTTFTGEFLGGLKYNGILEIKDSNGNTGTREYKNGKAGKIKKGKNIPSYKPSNSTIPVQNTKPQGCDDVEFIGAFKISGHGAINDIYVATIRNKASYTKRVFIEWLDAYGQTQRAAFDVKAGEKIDGRLGLSSPGVREPINVHMTYCD